MEIINVEAEHLNNYLPAHELKDLCLEWGFWSLSQTQESLVRPEYRLCVAREYANSPWAGALLSYHSPFTTDIIYLYVSPKHRGKGLSQLLLASLWASLGKEATMESLFLEVRKSNASAIRAYEKFGMKKIGLRESYYQDGEDALVFSKELKK